jgi:hypothetical protein
MSPKRKEKLEGWALTGTVDAIPAPHNTPAKSRTFGEIFMNILSELKETQSVGSVLPLCNSPMAYIVPQPDRS